MNTELPIMSAVARSSFKIKMYSNHVLFSPWSKHILTPKSPRSSWKHTLILWGVAGAGSTTSQPPDETQISSCKRKAHCKVQSSTYIWRSQKVDLLTERNLVVSTNFLKAFKLVDTLLFWNGNIHKGRFLAPLANQWMWQHRNHILIWDELTVS